MMTGSAVCRDGTLCHAGTHISNPFPNAARLVALTPDELLDAAEAHGVLACSAPEGAREWHAEQAAAHAAALSRFYVSVSE